MSDVKTINARYITESGTFFDHEAPWPHENSICLVWDKNEDDEVEIEFVYFGYHNNRVVYHDIAIEAKSDHLS
jgi:hypothetical protein